MTDRSRRDEERERLSREEHERRREDKERRSNELQEAWRRNHPSEEEEGRQGRPGRARPACAKSPHTMQGASYERSRRREATGRNGRRRERVVGVAAVMVGRSDLLRASRRVVFGADCARRGVSTRLGFGARLWPPLYSGGRVPQEGTIGGLCEPWARLLLLCAAGDEPMGIHKRCPYGGLRSCGCREGGPGLGGVVRSLFRGFGLLLLEGIVRVA